MLKTSDIFGAISLINKLGIMPQIRDIQKKNIELNYKKANIFDKVMVAKFDEINALEEDLKSKDINDLEIKQRLNEKAIDLLKNEYPELYKEAENINIELSSWKMDLINLIILNAEKAENDLYEWLSKYTGKDKQLYMDNPTEFINALTGVAEDPNLESLFNLMKKVFNK